jgi:hypothetical protein
MKQYSLVMFSIGSMFMLDVALACPAYAEDKRASKEQKSSAIAAAKPSQSDDEVLAYQLFKEALQLKNEGKQEEACERFFTSYRVSPKKSAAYFLGDCLEEQGRTRSAQRIFVEVAKMAKKDREHAKADEANARANALGARHSTIVVDVAPEASSIPGLIVRIDGVLVEPKEWNKTRIPIDAGSRTITATAQGYETLVIRRIISKGPTVNHVDIRGLAREVIPVIPQRQTIKKRDQSVRKEKALMIGGATAAIMGLGVVLIQSTAFDDMRIDYANKLRTGSLTFAVAGAFTFGWGLDLYRTKTSFWKKYAIVPRLTPSVFGFDLTASF